MTKKYHKTELRIVSVFMMKIPGIFIKCHKILTIDLKLIWNTWPLNYINHLNEAAGRNPELTVSCLNAYRLFIYYLLNMYVFVHSLRDYFWHADYYQDNFQNFIYQPILSIGNICDIGPILVVPCSNWHCDICIDSVAITSCPSYIILVAARHFV